MKNISCMDTMLSWVLGISMIFLSQYFILQVPELPDFQISGSDFYGFLYKIHIFVN